ncbi:hypothetical protein RI367_008785, partial [Sorochytrium milnesiophthora]
ARSFTTLNLKASFDQIQVREEDRHKTAFTWKNMQSMFVGGPIALKFPSAQFQES